jgi:hypothetical protein
VIEGVNRRLSLTVGADVRCSGGYGYWLYVTRWVVPDLLIVIA